MRADVVVTFFRSALRTTRKPTRFSFSRIAPPHGKAVPVPPQLNNEAFYSNLAANLMTARRKASAKINFQDDDYIYKVVRSIEEIRELIEAGFEYICQKEDLLFFRKRK